MAVEYDCCGVEFFVHVAIIVVLVLFAGLMSGLTLGLMSLSLVDLEVLAKSGTPQDRKHAAKILPVVKKQHLLLCTLLICNSAAMEALPIFLDSLVTAWGAILISVTLILLFGEIIPQSVCSRHGLAIGATVAPVVRVLVWICFPVAYPISKLLDYMLGDGHVALFRRAELKTLVKLHGNEAGKGGELTHDETTIIAGALELTEKTAKNSMTPLCQTFVIDVNRNLDRILMREILDRGHSRVPVFYEKKTNIIGVILVIISPDIFSCVFPVISPRKRATILQEYKRFDDKVKNLLSIHPDDEIPVKNVTIRKIPRVTEDMPLYDILNEFQKGHSHMAIVVKKNNLTENNYLDGDLSLDIDSDQKPIDKVVKITKPLHKWKSYPNSQISSRGNRVRRWSRDSTANVLHINGTDLQPFNEYEEAIGIITMEDVIEELLQEEIFDETDVHEDQ